MLRKYILLFSVSDQAFSTQKVFQSSCHNGRINVRVILDMEIRQFNGGVNWLIVIINRVFEKFCEPDRLNEYNFILQNWNSEIRSCSEKVVIRDPTILPIENICDWIVQGLKLG